MGFPAVKIFCYFLFRQPYPRSFYLLHNSGNDFPVVVLMRLLSLFYPKTAVFLIKPCTGFLAVIAFITVFNIINNISLSVTARVKQYGAFRAIGLSMKQLTKMIIAEALTYTISGAVTGTILGLIFHKLLFGMMISYNWGDPWAIPWTELGIIVLIMFFSIIFAVYSPVKRLQKMSIVENISAQ